MFIWHCLMQTASWWANIFHGHFKNSIHVENNERLEERLDGVGCKLRCQSESMDCSFLLKKSDSILNSILFYLRAISEVGFNRGSNGLPREVACAHRLWWEIGPIFYRNPLKPLFQFECNIGVARGFSFKSSRDWLEAAETRRRNYVRTVTKSVEETHCHPMPIPKIMDLKNPTMPNIFVLPFRYTMHT